MNKTSNGGVYYFLGNITSHVLHALPLYEKLGGTFIVLSERARRELEPYGVPVTVIDNKPYRWTRFGRIIKPYRHYFSVGRDLRRTVEYLNTHAGVVIFYELYDFAPDNRLNVPTIFLTHGNMLKDYMGSSDRVSKMKQYDYMVGLSPRLKDKFISLGIPEDKLVGLGIARTDDVVRHAGQIHLPRKIITKIGLDPKKKVVAYMPTFWGASSIYSTGLRILDEVPDEYTLIFRPHPQTPRNLLKKYLTIVKKRKNIIYAPEGRYPSLGLVEIFDMSSVIIGDVSSVMLEAILTRKPLVFAYGSGQGRQSSDDYKPIQAIVEASGEIENTTPDIASVIRTAVESRIDDKVWQRVIDDNFYHADGTSVQSISKFILSLINK